MTPSNMAISKLADAIIMILISISLLFMVCIGIISILYTIACLIVMVNQIERLLNICILPVQLWSYLECYTVS